MSTSIPADPVAFSSEQDLSMFLLSFSWFVFAPQFSLFFFFFKICDSVFPVSFNVNVISCDCGYTVQNQTELIQFWESSFELD